MSSSIAIGCALLASFVVGCAREAESAQDLSVVPMDAQVASERADHGRVKGADDAPIRVVEISDFQCPFCRQFHVETLGKVDSAYIETGRVSYLWISYAAPGHPRAFAAAEAAFCAGAAGMFWPMHDLLFEHQEAWSGADDAYEEFTGYAEQIGIEQSSFSACLRNSVMAPLLLRDFASVLQAGIQSTPYFILADSVAIRGAVDYATMSSALDTLLALRGSEQETPR